MSDTLREDILHSEAGQRMIETVTPIYDNSYVGLWMFEAMGREWDSLRALILSLKQELLPETATELISLWERRYGIVPPSGSTIEQRRQAVAQMRELPSPMSPYRLEQYLYNITGRSVEVIENVAEYTFGIIITGGDNDASLNMEALRKAIKSHKPSHMAYDLTMQAETKINIHVETGYWRFDYIFCGTLPQYNMTGGLADRQIRAQPQADSFVYPYPPCGVYTLGGGCL